MMAEMICYYIENKVLKKFKKTFKKLIFMEQIETYLTLLQNSTKHCELIFERLKSETFEDFKQETKGYTSVGLLFSKEILNIEDINEETFERLKVQSKALITIYYMSQSYLKQQEIHIDNLLKKVN